MAKTLVGLYDTLSDAEQVAQELIDYGYARGDIHISAHNGDTRHGVATQVGEWISPGMDGQIMDRLTDFGVPRDEASAYAEGVRRGGTLIIVESSDARAEQGLDIMNRLQPIDIDERVAQWRQESPLSPRREANEAVLADVDADRVYESSIEDRERLQPKRSQVESAEDVAIPVVQEELSVEKRQVVRGKVRIHTRVEERPVEETVRLREEHVTVERHPVNRPATEADLHAFREETIELTETAEVPVVNKQTRVVEEVVVGKEAQERVETIHETVRRKDVDIDQDHSRDSFSTYDTDWRQHHSTMFPNRGVYTAYEPAYRYGYDLASQERYRGRDWTDVEADFRRDWERQHQGTWEQFKDAIRYGWDKLRGRK